MRGKIFVTFLSILLTSAAFSQSYLDSGWIKVYYSSGDESKPYPRILLYVPGSNEPVRDSICTHKLEISKESFKVIRKSIEERKDIAQDSVLVDTNVLQLVISYRGELTIFLSPYLPRIRHILQIISSQLKDTDNDKLIKYQLNEIISRIIYDNRLNK